MRAVYEFIAELIIAVAIGVLIISAVIGSIDPTPATTEAPCKKN